MQRMVMMVVLGAIALALGGAPGAGAGGGGDVSIAATGTASTGELMSLTCDLHLLVVPSNRFGGGCTVTVGNDQLAIVGLGADGQRAITAVLDGRVTLRGVADAGTGRFFLLAGDGLAGFPLHLRLDPLGRAWGIERNVPGGGSETVAGGRLSEGTVVFAIR